MLYTVTRIPGLRGAYRKFLFNRLSASGEATLSALQKTEALVPN